MADILDRLSLRDLIKLGTTSRYLRYITKEHIRDRTRTLFNAADIDECRLRILLYNTGSVVSGSFVLRMHFPGTNGMFKFKPNDIDIYTSTSQALIVLRFIVNATPYKVVREIANSDYDTVKLGLSAIYSVSDGNGRSLNVLVSSCNNALTPILHFHSTLVMGWMTHAGLRHAYPDLTFNGIGLLNSQSLSVVRPKDIGAACDIVAKYTARGAKLVANPILVRHICGRSACCPSTVRTTTDSACFNFAFDTPVMGVTGPFLPSEDLPCVAWVRGGHPCRPRGAYVHRFVKAICAGSTRTAEGMWSFHSTWTGSNKPSQ